MVALRKNQTARHQKTGQKCLTRKLIPCCSKLKRLPCKNEQIFVSVSEKKLNHIQQGEDSYFPGFFFLDDL